MRRLWLSCSVFGHLFWVFRFTFAVGKWSLRRCCLRSLLLTRLFWVYTRSPLLFWWFLGVLCQLRLWLSWDHLGVIFWFCRILPFGFWLWVSAHLFMIAACWLSPWDPEWCTRRIVFGFWGFTCQGRSFIFTWWVGRLFIMFVWGEVICWWCLAWINPYWLLIMHVGWWDRRLWLLLIVALMNCRQVIDEGMLFGHWVNWFANWVGKLFNWVERFSCSIVFLSRQKIV